MASAIQLSVSLRSLSFSILQNAPLSYLHSAQSFCTNLRCTLSKSFAQRTWTFHLFSVKEQFDTRTPMGRAMMYIASVFAQLEREITAERIRDNMIELAKSGRWLGGNTPTGYKSEGYELLHIKEVNEENEVEAKVKKAYMLKQIPEEIILIDKLFYNI